MPQPEATNPAKRQGIRFTELIRALKFAIYSLWSPKVGFTIFYPKKGRWMAHTRGASFPVRKPNLEALEYFRHFTPDKGDTIFDCGAELGLETTQFSEIVGPEGKVYAFECLPDHVAHLKQLLQKHENVQIIEKACWNARTTLTFHPGHTDGSGSAVPDTRGQRGQKLADTEAPEIKVNADTLDSLWRGSANGRTVDLLKMDIEGAEYEALEGATEMLGNTRRAVIAAYHLRDGVPTAKRVAEILSNAGFDVRTDENLHVYATRSY